MKPSRDGQVLLSALDSGRSGQSVRVLDLGMVDYLSTQQQMQTLAQSKREEFESQIWLLEHHSVYTQGTSCVQSTLLPSDIPVVKSDRGGQITFHGPGQLVMYPLLDLRKFGLGVKALVNALEEAVISELHHYGITAERRANAPGVYVNNAKIAALGLRVKNGFSYHGLSLNIGMDLSPFGNIDPCGFQGLAVTSIQQELALSDTQVRAQFPLVPVGERLAETFLRLI